jgi:hypothetical protein
MVAPNFSANYCRISPLIKSGAYQFTRTEEKAPVDSDVHRSVLLCESTAYRTCLMSFLLAPVIWKWLVYFFFEFVHPCYTSYFNVVGSSCECSLHQRIPNSSRIWEPPQNSGPGKGDVKQFHDWGLKNFRHNSKNLVVRGFCTLGVHVVSYKPVKDPNEPWSFLKRILFLVTNKPFVQCKSAVVCVN